MCCKQTQKQLKLALVETLAFKKAPSSAPAVGIAHLHGSSAFIGKIFHYIYFKLPQAINKPSNIETKLVTIKFLLLYDFLGFHSNDPLADVWWLVLIRNYGPLKLAPFKFPKKNNLFFILVNSEFHNQTEKDEGCSVINAVKHKMQNKTKICRQ